jgi:hypothetical protein
MMNVFLAYYSPSEYEVLLKLADDRKNLDDKWEDWLFQYLRAKAGLSNEFEIEEIPLDVKKMDEYFRTKKLKNIGKNRANYVTEMGMKLHNQRNNN